MTRWLRRLDLPDPVIGLLLALGPLLALASAFAFPAPGSAAQHPHRVPFGVPFAWLTQDHVATGLPPSSDPELQAPCQIHLWSLAADAVCWIALLLAVAAASRLVARAIRPATCQAPAAL